jgi:hypothetical protein
VDLSLACMSVVSLANDVIASCNRAVAAAAPLDPSESAQPKRSGPPGLLGVPVRGERCVGRNLLRRDLGDELRSRAWGELAGLQVGDRVTLPGPGLRLSRAVLASNGGGVLYVDTLKNKRARVSRWCRWW